MEKFCQTNYDMIRNDIYFIYNIIKIIKEFQKVLSLELN